MWVSGMARGLYTRGCLEEGNRSISREGGGGGGDLILSDLNMYF